MEFICEFGCAGLTWLSHGNPVMVQSKEHDRSFNRGSVAIFFTNGNSQICGGIAIPVYYADAREDGELPNSA